MFFFDDISWKRALCRQRVAAVMLYLHAIGASYDVKTMMPYADATSPERIVFHGSRNAHFLPPCLLRRIID